MKKIAEIDGIGVIVEDQVICPWIAKWYSGRHREKRTLNPKWYEAALSSAQKQFLKNQKYVFRPHPRHSPCIELFIEEKDLDIRDEIMLQLLFNRRLIS